MHIRAILCSQCAYNSTYNNMIKPIYKVFASPDAITLLLFANKSCMIHNIIRKIYITYIQNIHRAAAVACFESSRSPALKCSTTTLPLPFFFSHLHPSSIAQPQSRLPLHSSYTQLARASTAVPEFPLGCARYIPAGWLSMRQTITRLTPLTRHLHNKLAAARRIYINVYTSILIHHYIILAKHVKCITHNNI